MKKILFINDHFVEGGAARVAAIQCNGLSAIEHIEVILVTDMSQGCLYPINSDISIKPIDVRTPPKGKLSLIKKWFNVTKSIRTYICEENPDAIITIQARMFLFTYLANIGLGYPIIVADHTSFNRKCGQLIDFVRNKLYSKAAGISVLTQKDYNLLGQKYPQKRVIYNPLSFEIFAGKSHRDKIILCAGRLDDWKVKGFDIIIDIWSRLESRYPEWTLCVAGDGKVPAKKQMANLIHSKGIENRVRLLGRIDNMKELYMRTSIFALPSRVEGFPMVLMEAMSQGCACVAFDVYGASSEMVDKGSGIVIKDGDIDAFEKALINLMEDDMLRESIKSCAPTAVLRFSVEAFVENWIKFINDIIRK